MADLTRAEIEEWRKTMMEVYVGDDDDSPGYTEKINALCDLALKGCAPPEAARSEWMDAEYSMPEKETETCSVEAVFKDVHGDAFTGYAYLDAPFWGRAFCRASRSNKYFTHWMPLPSVPSPLARITPIADAKVPMLDALNEPCKNCGKKPIDLMDFS